MPALLRGPIGGRRRGRYWLSSHIESHLLEQVAQVFSPLQQAGQDGSDGSLHRIRIAARRLRTGLRFFGELFAPSELRQCLQQLSRLTRLLGEIRTLDVRIRLLRRAPPALASAADLPTHLIQSLLGLRARKLTELGELLHILELSKFELRLRALITSRDLQPAADQLRRNASDQLNDLRRALRRRCKQYGKKETANAFHKFRLAARRYRYALEACEVIFQVSYASRVGTLVELLDHMGACEDLEELVGYLKTWSRTPAARDKKLAESGRRLVEFYRQKARDELRRVERLLEEKKPWGKKIRLQMQ